MKSSHLRSSGTPFFPLLSSLSCMVGAPFCLRVDFMRRTLFVPFPQRGGLFQSSPLLPPLISVPVPLSVQVLNETDAMKVSTIIVSVLFLVVVTPQVLLSLPSHLSSPLQNG